MINTRIFYTTNAGLYFSCGNSEILVDGIHDAGTVGFTPMPDEMKKQMASEEGLFAGQGALLFTHLHEDHYDEDMVREYIEQHPETALCGPGLESKGITDIGGNENEYRYRYRDFNIIAYKTKHSGSKRMDVPHYSLLLKNTGSDEVFFVAGDAVLEIHADEALKPGDCMVETPNGSVDARLATQMELIRQAVLEVKM